MGILGEDLDKINLEDESYYTFMKMILRIILLYPNILIRLLYRCNKFKKRKIFEKDISKESMPVAWYPVRSLD